MCHRGLATVADDQSAFSVGFRARCAYGWAMPLAMQLIHAGVAGATPVSAVLCADGAGHTAFPVAFIHGLPNPLPAGRGPPGHPFTTTTATRAKLPASALFLFPGRDPA
ncbi:hypothetical protein GCM10010399_59210 [Dactylosporangium fulvum]